MPKPLHITSIFAWICILSHLSLSAKAEVAAEAAAVAAAETVGGEDRALDGDIDRPCSLICLNGGSCQLSTDAEVAQLGHPSQYCSCPTGYGGITWCVRSYRTCSSMRRKLLRVCTTIITCYHSLLTVLHALFKNHSDPPASTLRSSVASMRLVSQTYHLKYTKTSLTLMLALLLMPMVMPPPNNKWM